MTMINLVAESVSIYPTHTGGAVRELAFTSTSINRDFSILVDSAIFHIDTQLPRIVEFTDMLWQTWQVQADHVNYYDEPLPGSFAERMLDPDDIDLLYL